MLRCKRKSRIILKILILILINLIIYSFVHNSISWKNQENYYDALNEKCTCASGGSPEAESGSSGQWCGPEATGRGPHQKVVSYGLYGSSADPQIVQRYFILLDQLADKIAHYYPGWIMRIYHQYDARDAVSMSYLCRVRCRNPHVDLCDVAGIVRDPDVANLINPEALAKVNPWVWRLFPAADPLVDYYLSRDIDSDIIDREIDAVQQWIQSNYTFHLMRDHQFHKAPLLVGLWGAKVYQKRSALQTVVQLVFRDSIEADKFSDQILMDKYMWPVMKPDVLAHDSYNCRSPVLLRKSVLPMFPFPTKRNELKDFVGNIVTRKSELRQTLIPCPVDCRPPKHQDWTYC